MAGWSVGTEKELTEWMSEMYNNLSTDDIWEKWWFGVLNGAFFHEGAVNNNPLLPFLESQLSPFFPKLLDPPDESGKTIEGGY